MENTKLKVTSAGDKVSVCLESIRDAIDKGHNVLEAVNQLEAELAKLTPEQLENPDGLKAICDDVSLWYHYTSEW